MSPSYFRPNVYVREVPSEIRIITGVPTAIAAFVGCTASGPVDEARQISSFAEFEQTFGGLDVDSALSYPVSHFFLNGGDTCWIVRTVDNDPEIGNRASKSGIYALEDADIFNILCLPGVHDVAALEEAVVYAEERRAMMIIDIDPNVNTFERACDWINDAANASLKRSNTAAYFPRIHVADPLRKDEPLAFANSGAMAGLWARTDRERGVWQAPAGRDAGLRGVRALDYPLSHVENGVLNPLGLNCLRTFPVYGVLSWGARTLIGADAWASEWKYLPVRRTALFLEESLCRGTRFAAFEPNGEPLWAQIRLAVESFMNDLFRQGAFQGTSARDAYFVKCDATTTSQADIDAGRVNLQVGFAPLKPAEFVIISVQQITEQRQDSSCGDPN